MCRSRGGHGSHQVGIRPRCVAHRADTVPTRWGSDPGVSLTGRTWFPPGGDQTQVCCSWGGHGAHQVGIRPRCVAHGARALNHQVGIRPRCVAYGAGALNHQTGIRPRCVPHEVDVLNHQVGIRPRYVTHGVDSLNHQVGIRPKCVTHGRTL